MSTTSNWDDPRDHQVKATYCGGYTKEIEVAEKRIFGRVVREAAKMKVNMEGDLSTAKGDVVPDDVLALRTFKHRCGLIKVVNVFSGRDSTATIYLDGFPNVIVSMSNTQFEFEPELENGPVADVTYSGLCTRRGEMELGRRDLFVTLVFKDQDQMKKFVVATTTAPNPKQSSSLQSSGYRTSDSDSSMWPIAAGVAIGLVLGS